MASQSRKVRWVLSSNHRRQLPRFLSILIAAVQPLACTLAPSPQTDNPFLGNWVTAENAAITIRADTVIQRQPDGASTTLDKSACRGAFRFVYGTKSRQALTGLVTRQPDLRQRLSDLLVEPNYPVAELDCDRGDQTYVLLNDHQLLAIYRDGDIGAIDRLARR
jgi:hypothetical protein